MTRDSSLANQLDRTRCMAGNRSPKLWVGLKRIMRRESLLLCETCMFGFVVFVISLMARTSVLLV
jgi:hypothetical protein